MNLLLDTQVLIWYLEANKQLRPAAKAAITTAPVVYVSAATILEITIKAMLAKLKAPANLQAAIVAKGFSVLAITGEVAEALGQFPQLARHDPFDRLLLTQAATQNLTLLTADQALVNLKLPYVMDARL
ncbi:type II toxin-antitoxin system VapC family toxin [Candidatus Parcubacteria bacterium]|nr:type II toxin-antitoxin system VapC family toxin [Candidatus Parcubacteria bacterium]